MPKWLASKEQLERTVIRAPLAGRVVGLRVFSVGGVIQAGQPILDIVPDAAPLIVKAIFAPGDIDGVYEGREAEVKFLSLHERDLPILLGTVRNVSADALVDEKSGRGDRTAEIVVPQSQLDMLKKVRGADTGIRPGVPGLDPGQAATAHRAPVHARSVDRGLLPVAARALIPSPTASTRPS
ncbi:HlyD family efflux transporter periplasmic adaptor subunit [Sphingomonas sp. MMS24-JH45]